jgi:hypothetical protein
MVTKAVVAVTVATGSVGTGAMHKEFLAVS